MLKLEIDNNQIFIVHLLGARHHAGHLISLAVESSFGFILSF